MADFSLPGDAALAASSKEEIWQLSKEEELRLEIEGGRGTEHKVVIKLISGTAELFGTELMIDREYTFSPSPAPSSSSSSSSLASSSSSSSSSSSDDSSNSMRFAIFSWHGCELKIRGQTKNPYKKSGTPMISYINAHAALENLRELTRQKHRKLGPRTLIVGPMDTGKSTLCRILLSYAVRAGNKPIFVDLDVGQNSISIPGTISATSIEHPISIEMSADIGGGGGSSNTLSIKSPLTYFYGHTSPSHAPELYSKLLDKLASVVERRMVEHETSNSSGLIINTCGWVDPKVGSPAYELIQSIAQKFSIDIILVLDHDQLSQSLQTDSRCAKLTIGQLSKSGGVHIRDELFRQRTRQKTIREYFYGSAYEFTPHQKVVHWKDMEIYRVGGGPSVPSSALPIGAKPKTDPNKLTRVTPSPDLLHSVLALSYSKDSSTLLETNVAGFVHVTGVDTVKKTVTLLTPTPGPLPNHIFITGAIKWMD